MGCNNSKVYPPTAQRGGYDGDNDDDKMKDNSILSQKNMAADDAIINQIQGRNNNLEIQVADPQALNKSILQQRQQAIDNRSYRSTIESWQPKSLQQLAETIKAFSKGKSMVDRYWIIFYWIAHNIEYDTVSYFSGKYGDQKAEAVFLTRKGVCAGFGNLYKYLSDQLQMPCEIVTGFSKGYGFEYRKNAPAKIDHAWNAVEIDHHWYLIEVTWGAGHLNDMNGFERKLDPFFFLPPPNEMIYHHFPENEKWQLLRTSAKLEQFMQLPHLRPAYFDFKIELISPRNQVYLSLLPGRPYALVLIRAPPDVYLMADVKLTDEDIDGSHHVMYDKHKQLYRCYFAPSSIGKHKIMIYAKKGDSDIGEYQSALEFVLDVKQMPKNIVSFPRTWKKFFDLGLEIISPQNTHMIKLNDGTNHTQIRIKAPENIELFGRLKNKNGQEVADGDHIHYDQRTKMWKCDFAPDREGLFEALIMAKKKSDPGGYTSAVSFKIDAKKISSAAAVSYPETWPLFDDLGLKIDAPKNSANAVWSDNASYAEVLMQAPKEIQLSCQIQYKNVKVENGSLAQYNQEKQHWQLLFAPERTGLHELIVFAKRIKDSQASADAVVKFNLDVTKLRRPMKFPMTYTEFQTRKCQIIDPVDGVLKKGSVVSIYCVIPGAIDVTVAVDSKMLESGGYSNHIFKRQVTVGSNDVIICAKYGQKSDYSGLVQYTVR
jgi:hypothetical protein